MYTELDLTIRPKQELLERRINYYSGEYDDILVYPEEFNSNMKLFINQFDLKYGKYKLKKSEEANLKRYIISDRVVNIYDVLDTLRPFEHELELVMWFQRRFEDEDYNVASAYILNFPKQCSYYEDWPDNEIYYPQNMHCDECEWYAFEFLEKLYIRPQNGVAKLLKEKIGGVVTPNQEPIVSLELYRILLDAGISSDYFRPVFSKKETVLGYKLFAANHILEPFAISDMSSTYLWVCKKCGNNIIQYNLEPCEEVQCFSGIMGGQGYPLKEDRIFIKEEALASLNSVNWTNEFFDGNRYVIVNKELFDLIVKYVPKAKYTSIPIFCDNRKIDYKII